MDDPTCINHCTNLTEVAETTDNSAITGCVTDAATGCNVQAIARKSASFRAYLLDSKIFGVVNLFTATLNLSRDPITLLLAITFVFEFRHTSYSSKVGRCADR